jgi:membrane-bound lytic murein transglycosylase F
MFSLQLAGLFSVVLLAACSSGSDSLDSILASRKLVVLIVNSPTAYYYDRDDQLAGPEYEMTQSFTRHLDVEVEYRAYDSTKQVIDALRNHEGHLVAAGLTINAARKQSFDFGPSYQTLDELLICHRDNRAIRSTDDLAGLEVVVAGESSFVDTLKQYPGIDWRSDNEHNTQYLLNEVAEGRLQCTVSDSTLFYIERRYHTELQNKYTLSENSHLAWMLNKDDDDLVDAIDDWFDEYKENELEQMLDKYYGYVEIFDYVDTHKFLRRIDIRLKKYQKYFIDAASKNGIDPVLLAAQSYQESHWNPRAKSPTGVRGIMMLTQPVAKSLGVKSRLNAKQNIYAGAKFHARMKKIVDDVPEPDRTWLALAAYNIGRGHFRDAQTLAKKLDKNPDTWNDMKDVLPLLAEKKYYTGLKYGYARGNEPVTYVTRIRNYEKLLHRRLDGKVWQ